MILPSWRACPVFRSSPGHVLAELLRQWPAYLAYLASFGLGGVIWVNHHQMFTRIAAVDTGLLWRNLALLLTVSVLPFPTAVLSNAFQHGNRFDEMTASVFYALAVTLNSAAWLALYRYLFVNERWLTRGVRPAFVAGEGRRALLGIASYLLAILIALWEPFVSLVILCALPVFYGSPAKGGTACGAAEGLLPRPSTRCTWASGARARSSPDPALMGVPDEDDLLGSTAAD